MLPSSSKMSDLAACLGIHRVSLARVARQNGIPGLVRTSMGRWRLRNRTAFKEFVDRYRREAKARCKRASSFQNDRERELRSAVRFHRERFPNDLTTGFHSALGALAHRFYDSLIFGQLWTILVQVLSKIRLEPD